MKRRYRHAVESAPAPVVVELMASSPPAGAAGAPYKFFAKGVPAPPRHLCEIRPTTARKNAEARARGGSRFTNGSP